MILCLFFKNILADLVALSCVLKSIFVSVSMHSTKQMHSKGYVRQPLPQAIGVFPHISHEGFPDMHSTWLQSAAAGQLKTTVCKCISTYQC